jgi:hypothetical protein
MNDRVSEDWLARYSPREWLRAALGELRQAETAFRVRQGKAGIAGLRRAAGMGFNAILRLQFNAGYGRTYMEHLTAAQTDESLPTPVREAAAMLLRVPSASGNVVVLRTPANDERLLEATRDVLAHAYTCVLHGEVDGDAAARSQELP